MCFFCLALFILRIHTPVMDAQERETMLKIAIDRVAVSLEALADSAEKIVNLLTALVTRRSAKGRKS